MVNSNQKGKRGEREVAALLRDYGFEARRGQQFAGGGDSPDVVHTMDGYHIEVKFTEALSLYKAMDQAIEDCKPGDTPIVFHRRKHKPWLAIIDAESLVDLIQTHKQLVERIRRW